ncbi:hypothetical protein ALC53_02006 [Atta colombica]|uniref:Uncharacterized protein n=1 Tax=Atta colombica TaxID=520822 RepID=A0A195BTE0_9HYME|nr:hypothetical protein ALC53_02006 [Atta colombica]
MRHWPHCRMFHVSGLQDVDAIAIDLFIHTSRRDFDTSLVDAYASAAQPPKEIDRLSRRFFWFPPFSIPLCPPHSNKRPCSLKSNSLPNKYRG